MENKKYLIKYFPEFIEQFNAILFYITYELKNKIVAENFYNEVIKQIEERSKSPKSYNIFYTTKRTKTNIYKINIKNYTIFYAVINNIMEVRNIYYSKRNFDKLL